MPTIRERWLEMKELRLTMDEVFSPEEQVSYCVDFLVWSRDRYLQQIKDNKRYVYMITFTLSPNSKADQKSVEEFISNQARRTALQIVKFEMVKEYTKKGVPHWHALVVSKKHLAKDRFKHYIENYGNIDISKSKSQDSQHIYDYIKKEPNHKILRVI